MKATRTCPGTSCLHWDAARDLCRRHFDRLAKRNCTVCGAEFESQNVRRTLCSERCGQVRYRAKKRGADPGRRRCQGCRESLPRPSFDSATRSVCRDCDAWKTTGIRTCRTCNVAQEVDQFNPRPKGARESDCKGCIADRDRARNSDPARLRQRRNRRLMYRFGITVDQYDQKLEQQGGVCAICLAPPPPGAVFHVDHDHGCCAGDKTCGNCVRDLLCFNCNVALGAIRDSLANAQRLVEYLRRHK